MTSKALRPPTGTRRLPWWLAVLLGIACVVLGIILIAKPFTSLQVLVALVAISFIATGINELASAPSARLRWLAAAVGVAWILAGVVVLAWAGITIHVLAILAGISLILGGVAKLVPAIRGDSDDRLIAALGGLAGTIFGLLALTWPDVTVLVLALLVGARTMLFGFAQIGAGLRRIRGSDSAEAPQGSRRSGWLRLIGAAASLLLALGLLGISALLHRGSPVVSAFYTPPSPVPSTPGVLLRSEPFTQAVPPEAHAWRILYTTTRDAHTPAVASGIVLAATHPPAGPRPIIAWAHGTTGYAENCAPSLAADPFTAGALPALNQIISHGWVLVATDYVGLGTTGPHPYLIGQGEARSVLDSVRAARRLTGLTLANNTVVWGHSQGGHAALWTGIIAPTYAPELKIAGVAAMAPASNLAGIVETLEKLTGGSAFASYALTAYNAVYPDVSFNHYVRSSVQSLLRRQADRCLTERQILASAASSLVVKGAFFAGDPTAGALGTRLSENTPDHPIRAPLLIAQGDADSLINPAGQGQFVQQLCTRGQGLEYRTYAGRGHVGLVAADSPLVPDLIRWTKERLAGAPQPLGCHRTSG